MGADGPQVVALVVSPGHNYWFHARDPADGVGPHPTSYPRQVDVVAGQGIRGDRFFGKVSRLASSVSLFAAEAVQAVEGERPLSPRSPLAPPARPHGGAGGPHLYALR